MKKYDVCIPRKYKDKNGNEKTHFWKVGDAWPFKDKEGISINLYTRILPSDKLLLFVTKEKENETKEVEEIEDDDIPF